MKEVVEPLEEKEPKEEEKEHDEEPLLEQAVLSSDAQITYDILRQLPGSEDSSEQPSKEWGSCINGIQVKIKDCSKKVKTGKSYGPCVDGYQIKQRTCTEAIQSEEEEESKETKESHKDKVSEDDKEAEDEQETKTIDEQEDNKEDKVEDTDANVQISSDMKLTYEILNALPVSEEERNTNSKPGEAVSTVSN